MSLFKKNKKGSALGAPKGKRKKRPRPPNASMPSADDINNSLPPQQQADGAVPPSASVSLDDLQKAKPNGKRNPRAKKRKKRPTGNKPSFLDKLGLGKKKKQPANLPPIANAEGQPASARPKKKPKPKSKASFLDKLGLGKKKKKQPLTPPVAQKPEANSPTETGNNAPAPASLSALDSIPTSAPVDNALKSKAKPKAKGRKKKGKTAGKKDKKSLKLIAGLVVGIIGLAVILLLLLPLLDDAEKGNLQGTVTGGNIENQQSTENNATEETAENNEEQAENTAETPQTPPPAENQAKQPVETATAQPQQPVNNQPVAPQKTGEQMMKSKSNSNQKITLSDEDFLKLSDSQIFRDE